MNYKIQTAPNAEPIDLEFTKNHLRVDTTDDDTYIETLITVARRTAEQISNHKMITQTWDIKMDSFPGSTTIKLPKSLSPLESVTHVKYTDEDDSESTFGSSNYVVDTYSDPGRIKLSDNTNWPSDTLTELNGVEIRVVVGYGDPDDVPMEMKQAILLIVGHLYENREDVTVGEVAREIPMGAVTLLMLDRNIPL